MAEGTEDDTEKTEEPSQKKLEDAREKGNVAKSQEVNSWFMLSGATLALALWAAPGASDLARPLAGLIGNSYRFSADGASVKALTIELAMVCMVAIGLPLLLMMLAGIAGNLVQHGPMWSVHPLQPKLSKISPLAGFKRLFSKQSLANFVKGLVKLAVVGGAVAIAVLPERTHIALSATSDVARLAPYLRQVVLAMAGTAVAVLAALAAADWLYQRHDWTRRQRMSIQELRDEYKRLEGDPKIKARIRQIRHARSRQRMMANLPQANVVIVNPTHYAVALKYEEGMNAPVCLAKGTDTVALRIRERAEEHDIPIVENPPLARALHKAVDVDAEVPPEHYRAVAEVIGYVMKLRRRGAR